MSTPNRNKAARVIQKIYRERLQPKIHQKQLSKNLIDECKGSYHSSSIIRSLLIKGANINTRDIYGMTPLMYACRNNYTDIVKVLLDAGANIYIKNTLDKTAFGYAKNKPEILRLLYAKKYNSNNNVKKITIVQKAFRQKKLNKEFLDEFDEDIHYLPDIDRIRDVLKRGANVDVRDTRGNTMLIMSCRYGGNIDIVKVLLGAGANVYARNKHGRTAFDYANTEIRKLLYAKKYKNIYDSMSSTNKHIRNKTVQGMQKIFKRKRSTKKLLEECQKSTPDMSIVRKLLDIGANINARDVHGSSSLLYACKHGNGEVVKVLIHHGAKVNTRDKNGTTPLLNACTQDNINVVKLLLHNGAKINARDTRGNTPLLFASAKGALDIVQLLVKHGAYIYAKNNDGKDAFQVSKRNVRKYIEKMYIEKKYKNMGSVRLSIRNVPVRVIQKAFKRIQPQIRRKQAATVIQRRVRQLPRIKAARTIQSVVRRHYATNRNSQLSKNAITLERIPRRNSIALNGQMYHRNSIASLVALGNARVPHSRRRIVTGANGRYTTA